MTQWLALALSLAIEVPAAVAGVLLLRWLPAPAAGRLAVVAAAATLITHPLAWNANIYLRHALPFVWRGLLIESAVVLVEGVLYARLARLGWRRGAAVSLGANGLSFGLGLLILRWMR